MRRIVVLLCMSLLFSSCYYVWPVYEYEELQPQAEETRQYVTITSIHLFVYQNKACVACKALLPNTIYNPNNYNITVTADEIDYVIAPLTTLELKEIP